MVDKNKKLEDLGYFIAHAFHHAVSGQSESPRFREFYRRTTKMLWDERGNPEYRVLNEERIDLLRNLLGISNWEGPQSLEIQNIVQGNSKGWRFLVKSHLLIPNLEDEVEAGLLTDIVNASRRELEGIHLNFGYFDSKDLKDLEKSGYALGETFKPNWHSLVPVNEEKAKIERCQKDLITDSLYAIGFAFPEFASAITYSDVHPVFSDRMIK